MELESSHGVNHDILLWLCRDPLPFKLICKEGFMDFFQKNAPGLHVPTPEVLSATALEDVYLAMKDAVEVK